MLLVEEMVATRETRGAIRYEAPAFTEKKGDPWVLFGNVYVRKAYMTETISAAGFPAKVTVSVEWPDTAELRSFTNQAIDLENLFKS